MNERCNNSATHAVDRSHGDDVRANDDFWVWGFSPTMFVCRDHVGERSSADIKHTEVMEPDWPARTCEQV